MLAIALLEAGQLEVVGKEGAAGHFTSGWAPPIWGTSGAKQVARGPGSKLAKSPRCGAKAEATEADEADVDAWSAMTFLRIAIPLYLFDLGMISAQTRSAFVARENRCPLFRIMPR